MKRIICSILCCVFLVPIVSAHSGRTDGNGGHYNSSTGEYHYHHGYPEHQHINGTCPYNFDDKTNHGSNSYHNEGAPKKSKSESSIFGSIVIWAIVAWISYHIIKFIVKAIIEGKKLKKEQKQKELDFLQKKQEYTLLYGGLTNIEILSLVNPPVGVSINQDGNLSFEESDSFFVYVSNTGKVYHKKGCNKKAINKKLFYSFYDKHKYKPCKKCKPSPLADDAWYREYSRILDIKNKYGIY